MLGSRGFFFGFEQISRTELSQTGIEVDINLEIQEQPFSGFLSLSLWGPAPASISPEVHSIPWRASDISHDHMIFWIQCGLFGQVVKPPKALVCPL